MTPRNVMPLLLTALVLSSCGTGPAAGDATVRQITEPAPGLQLTATLDHNRIVDGGRLTLQLDLINTGTAAIPLPGTFCRVTPITAIEDAGGKVVWSQPIPMIECANPPADEPLSMAPGSHRSAASCWQLNQNRAPCWVLHLPAGAYRVTGSFLNYPIPALGFTIAG